MVQETEYHIETNEDGEPSYRGWRLEIVPCGEQYLQPHPRDCVCGQPIYLAYPPYEGQTEDYDRVALLMGFTLRGSTYKPEYKDYYLSRHVAPDYWDLAPSIEAAVDIMEEGLARMRQEAWDEYRKGEA